MADKKYSILIISAEFSPLAKTGGLGDMVAALAAALRRQGHEVRLVLPLYGRVKGSGITLETALPSLRVAMGIGEEWCAVRYYEGADNLPLYFIEHNVFFDRPGLYNDQDYKDYPDNPSRFGFFCRAALQLAVDLNFTPQIIQVHDWQTALAPAYLKTWLADHPHLGRSASVLTIHNVSYQGIFPALPYRWLGLPAEDFNSDIFEDHGGMNFLKGGIHYADAVNTVSPTHAREMRAPYGAFGLAPYIANKGGRFWGILNGVDYDAWSPETDKLIPARYSVRDMTGKGLCKEELQRRFGLEGNAGIALIGFVGRLVLQKGVHLLQAVIERLVQDMAVQVVLLGTGEAEFEGYYATLPVRYPGKIGVYIGFDNELAHLIEAGADFFVMPSLYEPCGLNQMYSLKYGTLPIVHATGGLDDTVENYDEKTGDGTGFKFWNPSPEALYYTIGWAISTYYDRPHHLRLVRQRAMEQDFSWDRSVREYESLFSLALDVKKEGMYDGRK